MKKTNLSIVVIGIIVLAGAGYYLLFNRQTAENTNRNIDVDFISFFHYSEDLVVDLQTRVTSINLAIDKREDDADFDSQKKIVKNIETSEVLSSINYDDFYGSSNYINGYIAHITDYFGSTIYLSDAINNETYEILSVDLEQEQRIENLFISPTGKNLYIVLFKQYSEKDPIETLNNYRTETKLLKVNLANKSYETLFHTKDNLIANTIIWGNDEYLIIKRYGTEGGSASYKIFIIKDKSFLDFLDGDNAFLFSPNNKYVIIYPLYNYEYQNPADFKLYNLETEEYIPLIGGQNEALKVSPVEQWPNDTRIENVVWADNSEELVMPKLIFSEGDIDNADAEIISWNIFTGEVHIVSSFRTEEFSMWSVLGKVGSSVYTVGQTNNKDQMRVFPENIILENNISEIIYN